MPVSQPSGSTWELLGGVRFWLAMIVACTHLALLGHTARPIFWVAEGSSFVAVLCFLTMSGFSIAHALSGRPDGFYRRRFVRIDPLYVAALALGLLTTALAHGLRPADVRSSALNLAFLQTFVASPASGSGAVWSLAIEVACYAAAPVLSRLPTAGLVAITAVSAAAFPAVPWLHMTFYYAGYEWGVPLL